MKNKAKEFVKQNKDFSIFSIMSIISLIFSAVYPFIIAKIFSLDEYAVFSTNKMFTRFFMIIFLAPSIQPFVLFAQKEFFKKKKIEQAFTLQSLVYLASLVAILLFTAIFGNSLEQYIGITSLQRYILMIFFVFLSTKELIRSFLLANEQRIGSSLMEVLYNTTLIVVAIITILLGTSFDMTSVLIGYTMGALTSSLLGFILLKKENFKINFKFDRKTTKEFFKFMGWQVFGLTGIFLLSWGDNLILKQYIDQTDLGAYNFAYGIFSAAISVGKMMSQYFLTKILKILDNKKALKKYTNVHKPALTLAYSVVTAGVMLVAPFLINFVYGNKYEVAYTSLYILLAASVFDFNFAFNKPLLEGSNNYRFQQINNLIAVSINMVLNVIFIQKWGMEGAAIATLIAFLYKSLVSEIFVRREIKK